MVFGYFSEIDKCNLDIGERKIKSPCDLILSTAIK